MKDLALIQSEVMDIMNDWKPKGRKIPIEMNKIDYNLYGDHKQVRPYKTIIEGVNWYLHQRDIQHIPEELVLPLVAHNFGISIVEAVEKIKKTTECEYGLVDLS